MPLTEALMAYWRYAAQRRAAEVKVEQFAMNARHVSLRRKFPRYRGVPVDACSHCRLDWKNRLYYPSPGPSRQNCCFINQQNAAVQLAVEDLLFGVNVSPAQRTELYIAFERGWKYASQGRLGLGASGRERGRQRVRRRRMRKT